MSIAVKFSLLQVLCSCGKAGVRECVGWPLHLTNSVVNPIIKQHILGFIGFRARDPQPPKPSPAVTVLGANFDTSGARGGRELAWS